MDNVQNCDSYVNIPSSEPIDVKLTVVEILKIETTFGLKNPMFHRCLHKNHKVNNRDDTNPNIRCQFYKNPKPHYIVDSPRPFFWCSFLLEAESTPGP
jgi:hypothetical protein